MSISECVYVIPNKIKKIIISEVKGDTVRLKYNIQYL